MRSIDGRNNVKIYNLSAGRALPDWLSDRKKRKLAKRDVDIQRRIELIQDFNMPDVSNAVNVSSDGQYILATGTYKPRIKCFEVAALSQKFERCFDSEVVDFKVLSDDYSKLVFLQEERFVEFHNQAGRWFRTRIPKFGRDLAYHYPSCDLYIAASGSEVYRLNLNEGKFLNPIQTESPSVNKCLFNPVHYLFTCGTSDGRLETWDPRSRHRVGVLDCALHMAQEHIQLPEYKTAKDLGITSLAYKDALSLAVGTRTGHILMYDIRSDKPLLVKDHMDGFAIKSLAFDAASDMVLSMSTNAVKIWEQDTGKPHTSIESDVKFNDMCHIPNSGMIFLATEDPKMQIYFLPSMGPAPKWCGHLDALIEELEEEDITPIYDDYKFVTEQELRQIGLDTLIGTNILRAVMHGYYIDVRLYNKAKQNSNIMDKDALLKKKVKKKMQEQNERKIAPTKLINEPTPEVNKDFFQSLKRNTQKASSSKSELSLKVLQDSRFSSLFSDKDAEFDKTSDAFQLIQPLSAKDVKRRKQMASESESEEERNTSTKNRTKRLPTEAKQSDSDSDSIESKSDTSDGLSSRSDEETVAVNEPKKVKVQKKRRTKKAAADEDKGESGTNEFLSVDSFAELDDSWNLQKKAPLGLRLEGRDEDESSDEEKIQQSGFGKKEMKFSFSDSKAEKFENLRKRQKDHQKERRQLVRNTKSIRGKIRMNKPFI